MGWGGGGEPCLPSTKPIYFSIGIKVLLLVMTQQQNRFFKSKPQRKKKKEKTMNADIRKWGKAQGFLYCDSERLSHSVLTLGNNIMYHFLTYTCLNFRWPFFLTWQHLLKGFYFYIYRFFNQKSREKKKNTLNADIRKWGKAQGFL